MKEFVLEPVADFREQLGNRDIYTICVGAYHEALILAVPQGMTDERFKPYVQSGWTMFYPDLKPTYKAAILEFSPHFIREIHFTNGAGLGHNFCLLNENEILTVRGRSAPREKNATVYDFDRVVKRQFALGDGIEDVQTAVDGTIWVSYFDEGVFGHNPLSNAGLVRFNDNGDVLWKFEPPQNCDYIADCYTMNVSELYVWICYYTNFPIVRIPLFGGYSKGWQNEFSGAKALTTDNHRVLLYGGYKGQRTRCVVQEFGDDKMVRAREIKLMLDEGEMPERVRAIGRGSTLHLFVGTKWYQFDLAEVDA